MSLQPSHIPPPQDAGSDAPGQIRQHTRQLAQAVGGVMQGRMNNVAPFTCMPGASLTILTDSRLSAQGAVAFDPLTASAAAELAAGTLYVLAADRSKGAYRVTHSSAGSTDRSFRVIIIG